MTLDEIKSYLEDPAVIEKQEIPPDSGYWLFIKEDAPIFEVYSLATYSTAKDNIRYITRALNIEYARRIVREQSEKHLEYLAKRNAGSPTPNQLAFLFKQKIPIPLDLTFGQASTIIDEEIARLKHEQQQKMEEKRKKKEQEEAEKYLRIQTYLKQFPIGKAITHQIYGKGAIMDNNGETLSVQFERAGLRALSLSHVILREKKQSEEQL